MANRPVEDLVLIHHRTTTTALPGAVKGVTPSSLVHTHETKSPTPDGVIRRAQWGDPLYSIQPASDAEQRFRHSGWAVRRNQVYAALQRTNRGEKRIDRFVNCGSCLTICLSANADEIKLGCNQCHDRFCIPCANGRAASFVENLAREVDVTKCRFLTLTLRHSHTPLTEQLDRLYRSFSVLRRRESFRSHVKGGAAFVEVKLAKDGVMWHPHLHVIIEGTFWDQREISREWHCVTGDSSIVHIQEIRQSEDAARYVCKYVTKPADSALFAVPEKLDELMCSIQGRRLCLTFGSWRGIRLDAPPPEDGAWQTAKPVSMLQAEAQRGDPLAVRLLEAAARKYPLFASHFGIPPPDTVEVP